MKTFNVLLIIILLIIFFNIPVNSSTNISPEDLLKFRNIQYEQAKRVVRMQDLRTEFERLNTENEQLKIQIDDWIKDQAKKQNIDLTKYYFDSDQLKFVEIKKNE